MPEFAALITRIDAAVRNVLAFTKVADAPFRITGCWVQVRHTPRTAIPTIF
jgi:hypothetical protein